MPFPIVGIIVGAAVRALGGAAVRAGAAAVARRQIQRTLRRKIDDAIKAAEKKLKKAKEDRDKNCKNCGPDKDPCKALKKGDPDGGGDHRGGSYGGTNGQGHRGVESNHAPANSASRDAGGPSRSQGPSIQMDRADHQRTMSHGNQGSAAQAYRDQQADLIRGGRIEEAFAMDVADVMRIAAEIGDPLKYADAIAEAAAYLWCMKKHGLA